MQGTLLAAAISPDNTPHGYNLTFAFPMLMFIVISAVLYLRFRGPHRAGSAGPAGPGGLAGPEHDGTTGGSTLHEGGSAVAGPASADEPGVAGSAGAVRESEDGE
ncbi:MAG TPA: hypothetical protein VN695_18335 [Streptosporangiaceae bacterium]|nr:hypothetical protein [Streptosporangiaceae bacterium]